MSRPCTEHAAVLVDHLADDLEPLETLLTDTHLDHCAQCRRVRGRIAVGFEAARSYRPEVDSTELERLTGAVLALSTADLPQLAFDDDEPAGDRQAGLRKVLAGLAIAAGIAAAVVAWPKDEVSVEPLQSMPTIVAAPEPVRRDRPTPHLEVVSSPNWDGAYEIDGPKDVQVEMSRGFAVLAFEGGAGRRLAVAAPGLTVQVVGTRFFVDAQARHTVVGVAEGTIRVARAGGEDQLVAPTVRTYDRRGNPVEPAASEATGHTADPFFTPKRHPKPRPRRSPEALMREAEVKAAKGAPTDALAAYDRALKHPRVGALAALIRYQRARLLAFALDRPGEARAELGKLSSSADVEVRQQARLAMCELDRVRDRCEAQACLRRIDAADARALLWRWSLDEIRCDR